MAVKLFRDLAAVTHKLTLKPVGHQSTNWMVPLVFMMGNGRKTLSGLRGSDYETHLETSGAPVHELDGPLGLDGGDGGIHVLGHHVTAVEHAARHVLPCRIMT
jgi:hypothetical protein